MRFLSWYVPFALKMANLPVFGTAMKKWVFPVFVADESLRLSEEASFQWSTLNTFDWFTPHYSWAHSPEEVRGWLQDLGFTRIEQQSLLVAFRAEKPA